jgi:hypothetical protein
VSFLRRRARFLVLGRLLGGDTRKWLIYFAATAGLRTLRKYLRGAPETVYMTTLRPEERLGVLTTRPLPSRLVTKRLRKALEAESRAELGA